MGRPNQKSSRRFLTTASPAVVIFTIANLVFGASGSHATGVRSWTSELNRDLARVVSLQSEIRDLKSQSRALKSERNSLTVVVEERLVALYKAGDASVLDEFFNAGSFDAMTELANVSEMIERHNAREFDRFMRVVDEQKNTAKRMERARKDLEAARSQIKHDRRELWKAHKAAERAARRRARMAKVADSPLIPRALSPESVTSATASEKPQSRPEPTPEPTPANQAVAGSAGFVETGIASVYASYFNGKPTASGEPFDPGALTAAHRTLPLGSWVVVHGPAGSVLVKINDRGPFVSGRIIDLSPASARAVGVNGTAMVTVSGQQ